MNSIIDTSQRLKKESECLQMNLHSQENNFSIT